MDMLYDEKTTEYIHYLLSSLSFENDSTLAP